MLQYGFRGVWWEFPSNTWWKCQETMRDLQGHNGESAFEIVGGIHKIISSSTSLPVYSLQSSSSLIPSKMPPLLSLKPLSYPIDTLQRIVHLISGLTRLSSCLSINTVMVSLQHLHTPALLWYTQTTSVLFQNFPVHSSNFRKSCLGCVGAFLKSSKQI